MGVFCFKFLNIFVKFIYIKICSSCIFVYLFLGILWPVKEKLYVLVYVSYIYKVKVNFVLEQATKA
jgi:hypothetical protein